MKCPKCQSENPEGTRFCGQCAAPLQPEDRREATDIKGKDKTKVFPHPEDLKETAVRWTTGTTFADRYQIIEELGEGGMGKVYKVLDKEVDAKIAIKLIKPEIASDVKTIERFRRELRTTRNISHKNVCRVYDLSKAEGTYFITMEYISGQDLKSLIKQAGQLNVGTAVNIARQVSEGLAEAHQKGVVHRDLKPGNIMIDQEGGVRIMDFGIARSFEAKELTGAGRVIGTPEYMSPEQVEGKEADVRSDIYALGLILYEMLTGRGPFEGTTPLIIALKHKTEKASDPRNINDQIPGGLSRLILKCLEKNPDDRYKNMNELLADLSRIEVGIPEIQKEIPRARTRASREVTVTFNVKKVLVPFLAVVTLAALAIVLWKVAFQKKETVIPEEDKYSLAVISFENQTGDASYDYLQKAIPNLLITSLEQSNNFKVTTWERLRDLLKQMEKSDVDVIDSDLGFELCRKEGIDIIVLGSFVKAGNMFATDVKVLDVTTKNMLASIGSRGEGEDSILRNQIDELSREISERIVPPERITELDVSPIIDVTTSSMEAYNHFLKGREELEKMYYVDARHSIEKAVALDPEFAMAYFYLVILYQYFGLESERDEALEKFQEYGKKVGGKEGLYIKAQIARIVERDRNKYQELLREVVRKYPKEKRYRNELGVIFWLQEKYDDAIEEFELTLELDPKYGPALNQIAYCYIAKNDFKRALDYFEQYAEVSPGDANPLDSMGEMSFQMGKFEEAEAKFKEALELKPDFASSWKIGYIYALREDYAEALKWTDRFISSAPSDAHRSAGFQLKAFYLSLLGRLEEAFKILDDAEELLKDSGQPAMKDFLLRIRLWICYEWEMWEKFDEWQKIRMDFRKNNDRGSEVVNTMISQYYEGLLDLKSDRLGSARSKLSEIQALYPRVEEQRKDSMREVVEDFSVKLLFAEGAVDEAVNIFNKMEVSPVSFSVPGTFITRNLPYKEDFLAQAFMRKGETARAIAEYERMIATDFVSNEFGLIHPFIRYRLARLYEQNGQKEKAEAEFAKLADIWKDADKGLAFVEDAKKRWGRSPKGQV